jgi:hypothetical protein
MGIKLNKESYQFLIDEDIKELKKSMEDTLVRKHIIAVLEESVKFHYPVRIYTRTDVTDINLS